MEEERVALFSDVWRVPNALTRAHFPHPKTGYLGTLDLLPELEVADYGRGHDGEV